MSEDNNTQELDEKDLKILAYKERVSELEEQVADLRVQVTILSHRLAEHEKEDAETSEEK